MVFYVPYQSDISPFFRIAQIGWSNLDMACWRLLKVLASSEFQNWPHIHIDRYISFVGVWRKTRCPQLCYMSTDIMIDNNCIMSHVHISCIMTTCSTTNTLALREAPCRDHIEAREPLLRHVLIAVIVTGMGPPSCRWRGYTGKESREPSEDRRPISRFL
jgi:hypothetical protein